MTIKIELPDEKTNLLSSKGLSKLTEVGTDYLNDILDESERLAMTRNTANTELEITASIVTDAEVYQRKYRTVKRPKKSIIGLQIGTFVTSLLAGGFFDIKEFTKLPYLLTFFTFFTIAIVTYIFSIILGVKND